MFGIFSGPTRSNSPSCPAASRSYPPKTTTSHVYVPWVARSFASFWAELPVASYTTLALNFFSKGAMINFFISSS